MGSTNPERLMDPIIPAAALTVADMMAAGWTVTARCDTCRTELKVCLADQARLRGPDLVLWNRHPACRRVGCDQGRVTFRANGGRGFIYKPLVASGYDLKRLAEARLAAGGG